MSDQDRVLEILAGKEDPVKTADLAKELKTSQSNIRTYISRLKKKGFVDGDPDTGWGITEIGAETVDKGEHVSTTVKDVGKDELSMFKKYGDLSGAERDDVAVAAELFQNRDMRDMTEVKRVLAEANIPTTVRTKWENLYRNYLRMSTPPEERDERYPLPKASEGRTRTETAETGKEPDTDGDGLDFIVEGPEVHRVAEGMGDFTFNQAIKVLQAKRGLGGGGGGGVDLPAAFTAFTDALKNMKPDTTITVHDLMDWVDKIRGSGGDDGRGPTGYIGPDGEYHEADPKQPIIIEKKAENPPPKHIVYKQTAKGLEKVQYEPGEPIIIEMQAPPTGGGGMSMMPWPVTDAAGKPVTDKEGRQVYTNIQPMMTWMQFNNDQRRAEERHQALMSTAKTIRDNLPDGIAALREAATEARKELEAGKPAEKQPQVYECGKCKTQFKIPAVDFERIACPSCKQEYTKEEVQRA